MGDPLDATVACALSDGTVRVHDLRAPTDARALAAPGSGRLTAVCWRPGRRALAAGSGDGSLHVWDPRNWKLALHLRGGHADPCYGASWRPDGRHLVSWSSDGVLAWWDADVDSATGLAVAARAPLARVAAGGVAPMPVFHAAFADDGALVAVGGGGEHCARPDALVRSVVVVDLPAAGYAPRAAHAAADAADAGRPAFADAAWPPGPDAAPPACGVDYKVVGRPKPQVVGQKRHASWDAAFD